MNNRNKYSFSNIVRCTALLLSAACIWGGCTEMTEPQVIGEAGSGTSLTIRATVGSYTATGGEDAPSTRIPAEEGFTTEFSNGDDIGIFALKNFEEPSVATIDDVYNLKLVYTKAADGTGSWAPAAGDTRVLYSYNDDLTYVAYYPYREGITIKQDLTYKIFEDLANNAKLQPAADQSTPAAYTGSDLMAAVAKPTTDPANANKKVLTLKFEHLHALLVLKPMGLVNCVAPEGAGYEYSDRVLGPDAAAKDAIINGVKALRMDNGTFRTIVKVTPTDDVIPIGSYTTIGDKEILYTGTALAAGMLVAGKCYTQQVEIQLPTDGSVTRALRVGDYYCRDGKILAYETPVIKNPTDCVGVVTLLASGSDANFGGNCVDNKIRAHVVSVYEVASCKWGPNGGALAPTSHDINNDVGYLNTHFMKQTAETDFGSLSASNYAAAYYCLNYSNTDKGRLQTDKNSGWYFPSRSFMWALTAKPAAVISSFNKLVAAGYGQNLSWGQYHWTSSTANWTGTDKARMVKLGETGSYGPARSQPSRVRAELTF